MTLTTHILTGAVAAQTFTSHPVEAFLAGWVSHYVMDAIAHWDYSLDSFESHPEEPLKTRVHLNRAFIKDASKVVIDAVLGFAILFLVTAGHINKSELLLLYVGGLGGVVPDFLQFLYGVTKNRLLGQMQRFHNFVHASREMKKKQILGISIQIAIVFLLCFLLRYSL